MLYYFYPPAIPPTNSLLITFFISSLLIIRYSKDFIKVRVILFESIIYVIILIILNYFVNFARVFILSDLY